MKWHTEQRKISDLIPTERKGALKNNNIKYLGSPCKKCGSTVRYTKNGSCVDCMNKQKGTTIFIKCIGCGKIFETHKREKTRPIQKYCSRKCYGIYAVAKTKKCKHCNKEYINYQNKYFCSMFCSGAYKAGKKMSEAHKQSLRGARPHLRGKKSFFWKGGRSNFRNQERVRFEYKNWRKEVFVRDKFTCQLCKKTGGYLEAHHIIRWIDNEPLRYEITNGITLCKHCHKEIHYCKTKNQKRVA